MTRFYDQLIPVKVPYKDLRWIAQAVHQAYHAEREAMYWDVCPKSVCVLVVRLLDEHEAALHAEFCQQSLPCPSHGRCRVSARPSDLTEGVR